MVIGLIQLLFSRRFIAPSFDMLVWDVLYGVKLNGKWMKHKGKYQFAISCSEEQFLVINSETNKNEESASIDDILAKKYRVFILIPESKAKIIFMIESRNIRKEFCVKFFNSGDLNDAVDSLAGIGFQVKRSYNQNVIQEKDNTSMSFFNDLNNPGLKTYILQCLSDPNFHLMVSQLKTLLTDIKDNIPKDI